MVVVGFELGWWDVADLAVEAAVVEPFDVRQCGQLDGLGVAPGAFTFGQLGLIERVHGFSEGVDAALSGRSK